MSRLILIAAMLAVPYASAAQDAETDQLAEQAAVNSDKPDEAVVKLDPRGEARKPSVWMKQKLSLAERVFEGLTEGNLVKAREAAQTMSLLNKLELFVRRRSPAYRSQLRMFQFANTEIIEGAMEDNLERATLAYTQLSISCISCHKQLRKAPE